MSSRSNDDSAESAAHPGHRSRPVQRRRGDGRHTLAQTRVLYVEDDSAARDQLAQFLRRRVKELYIATDGLEGIEAFHLHHPDMVVTDVRMARLDGLAMVRQMKALDETVPIVVTSSFSDAHYLLQAIEIGVERYVLKPVDIERLVDALEFCSRISQAERGLRLSQAIIESASEAVVVLDPTGKIASANPAFHGMTGYAGTAILGKDVDVLLTEADRGALNESDGHAARRWRGELAMRRADGTTFHAMCSVDPVSAPNGAVQHRVLMFYDVTEARNAREQMQYLAYYDPLTGLANRHLFDEQLRNAMEHAQGSKSQIGLLFVDLDRFKDVNDRHGHAIGDLLLREVGQRMRDAVRDQDLVSRRSGDEFVVLLRQISEAGEAGIVAERVRAAVEAPLSFEGRSVAITCSVGAAVYPRDASDARTLLRHADSVMYEAKKDGGNRTRSS